MGVVTAQLLFVEQPDATSVCTDVIVLDRAEAPNSPEVGAPLTFGFGLPVDDVERDHLLTVLRNWARRSATVEMAIRTRRGVDEVELQSGVASIVLRPRIPHDAP